MQWKDSFNTLRMGLNVSIIIFHAEEKRIAAKTVCLELAEIICIICGYEIKQD
jgi:hypothetical protein